MGLNDILPAKARKVAYAVYAFLGLGFTATTTGFLAAEQGLPVWLVVAVAVYGVVGTGFGFTAAANTTPTEYALLDSRVEGPIVAGRVLPGAEGN